MKELNRVTIHCLGAAVPMEMGLLPLPRDAVLQSLDAHALTLLCPPPLGSPLSISFMPWHARSGCACFLALHIAIVVSDRICLVRS